MSCYRRSWSAITPGLLNISVETATPDGATETTTLNVRMSEEQHLAAAMDHLKAAASLRARREAAAIASPQSGPL